MQAGTEPRRDTLTGSGVTRGIAIGRAHLLAPSELDVRQVTIERRDVVHEIARMTRAFAVVRDELDGLKGGISPDAPTEVRAFLDLHRLILDDALLSEAPRDLIRTRLINAEWALTIQLEEVCKQFEAIDDEYLRERSTDVRQVVERVLNSLAEGTPTRVTLPKKIAPGAGGCAAPEGSCGPRPGGLRDRARGADLAYGDSCAQPGAAGDCRRRSRTRAHR